MRKARILSIFGDSRGTLRTEEVRDPVGTEVLVKTLFVSLCGSDIALYRGTYTGPHLYPVCPGHEWVGIVEAVGEKVTKFNPGDIVTGDCSIYCGRCALCKKDKNLCTGIKKFGITIPGALREFFIQDAQYLYKAPSIPDLHLFALTEPLAVSAHAIHRVVKIDPSLRAGKALIIGGGPIGLGCLLMAMHVFGFRHVELFDILAPRVEKAISLGAKKLTCSILESASAINNDYKSLYARTYYDLILETSGAPAAFSQALELLRPLGFVVSIGFVPLVEISPRVLTLKAGTVIGSIGGTGHFDVSLRFILEHPELVSKLITHTFTLEEWKQAFEIASDRKKAMKVLIKVGGVE